MVVCFFLLLFSFSVTFRLPPASPSSSAYINRPQRIPLRSAAACSDPRPIPAAPESSATWSTRAPGRPAGKWSCRSTSSTTVPCPCRPESTCRTRAASAQRRTGSFGEPKRRRAETGGENGPVSGHLVKVLGWKLEIQLLTSIWLFLL